MPAKNGKRDTQKTDQGYEIGIGVYHEGTQVEGIVWNELSPDQEARAYEWARSKWGPTVEIRALTDGEMVSMAMFGESLLTAAQGRGPVFKTNGL